MAQWYSFTTTGGADLANPANYTPIGINKPSCPGSDKICAVFSSEASLVIDCNLITEMVIAMQTKTDSTRVALRF